MAQPWSRVQLTLKGSGHGASEEAEPWDLNGVAVAVRFDVEDLDVEEITRFGALDVDGAGGAEGRSR